MYPVAKNRTVFTPELFQEAYKELWAKPYFKSTRKLLYIVAAFFIVSLIYILSKGLPIIFLGTEVFFLVFILLYICVMTPRNLKKRIYKKMGVSATDAAYRDYAFYEDHMVVTFPDESSNTYKYSDIEHIYKGKNIFILYTNGENNVLIDKNAFDGALPEFLR